VRREQELRERLGPERVRDALANARVWGYGLVNFVLLAAGFGLTFFVPDLVQDRTGYTDFEVGALAAIPFAFATAAMIAASRRPGGLAPLMVAGAAGTLLTAYAESPLLLTVGITLAAVGLLAALPRFWIGPTALLSGTAAAAGIALVAVLGNLGGFVGPAFTGIAKDQTGGYEMPLVTLGLILLACALVTTLGSERRSEAQAQPVRR
jgi:predicted MFS family arabinose efflux permease